MRAGLVLLVACSSTPGSSEPRTVFVTADIFTGDMMNNGAGTDGIDGADRLCAERAMRAGLAGSYLAWISSGTTNAIDRMRDGGPWQRTDGALAFQSHAALADRPAVTITIDENGHALQSPLTAENHVWTGTLTGGTASTRDCQHWTNSTGGINGEFGATDRIAEWTESSDVATGCAPRFRLYCFEQ